MKKAFDIGILGGGQLGRMLIEAGRPWGLTYKVLDPAEEAPCAQIADSFLCAPLTDMPALRIMAESCDVLTIEIEQVDANALATLEAAGHHVLPAAAHIAQLQDKGLQKKMFQAHGFPTAPFACIASAKEALQYAHLFPAALKLRCAGYDGKGVVMCKDAHAVATAGFTTPTYIESQVNIQKELSVIVVRNQAGDMRHYAPVEMVFHEANLLDHLISPADIPTTVAEQAVDLAQAVCQTLNYVGVLAVELFWTKAGDVLINELAPRVHNSGHHTREAHDCSQFGQLLRVLKGWPLGSTSARSMAALVNILGPATGSFRPHYVGLDKVLAARGCYVYLYGKAVSKPHRKMGHVTILAQDKKMLTERLHFVKRQLCIQPTIPDV